MKALLFFCMGIMLCACPPGPNPPGVIPEPLISPSIADSLMKHLIMPEGTQLFNGQVPAPANSGAPRVEIENSNVLSSNGATTPIHVTYTEALNDVIGLYAQVEGSSFYFMMPYDGQSATGQIHLPIGIPANVDKGEFCISFCAFDADGRVSDPAKACITVLRLGTGTVQVNLTWDNATDQDLIVYDPNGEEIYSSRPSTHTEGILDRHDKDGFGPENIYWYDTAPDGDYTVAVQDKTGNGGTSNFMVTVNGNGVSRNVSGTTVNGNKVNVVTFTKTGDSIFF